MSDMKCPICGTILDKAFINDKIRGCPKCRNMGNIELWQELIKLMEENERTRKALETGNKDLSDKIGKLENDLERTRKALEIATHRLNQIAQHDCDQGCMYVAQNAIEEITALEKSELENLEMLVNNVFK